MMMQSRTFRTCMYFLMIVWAGCEAPPALVDHPSDPLASKPVPLPPGNVTIATISKTEYRLAWEDGSSFVTGYLIERFPGRGAKTPDTIRTTDRFLVETGMDTAATHTYQIHALCDGRAGLSASPLTVRFSRNEVFAMDDPSFPTAIKLFPNGHAFLTSSYTWGLSLRSLSDPARRENYAPDYGQITSFNLSARGARLALGILASGELSCVSVWNTDDHSLVRRIYGYAPRLLTFSPDGKTLAFTDQNQHVIMYGVDDGAVRRPIPTYGGLILDAIFSSDGRSFVTAWDTHTIRLHDVAHGYQTVATISLPALSNAAFLAISADGSLVAAACTDEKLRIWRTIDGALIGSTACVPDRGIYFLGDTHTLTAVREGILLINGDTGEVERSLGYPYQFFSYTVSPDGKSVITVDGHVLRCWSTGAYWWIVPRQSMSGPAECGND